MTDINETLQQRGTRYGEFIDNAATAQTMKALLRDRPSWLDLADDQRQALDVICDKISRIMSGDPNYADNWHDIAGYATLVEKRLAAPIAPSDVAPDPEYVPDTAPLEQLALSQDDDPAWGPWRPVWSLDLERYLMQRCDAQGNYQTYDYNGTRVLYITRDSVQQRADKLNRQNKP